MLLALSRSPRAINLKFTPDIFYPRKYPADANGHSYISFGQMGE